MEDEFIIECRYQYYAQEGKTWTKWYPCVTLPLKKEEAENLIKERNANDADIDRASKSKHEYRLKPYSEYEEDLMELLNAAEKRKTNSNPKRKKKNARD